VPSNVVLFLCYLRLSAFCGCVSYRRHDREIEQRAPGVAVVLRDGPPHSHMWRADLPVQLRALFGEN